MSPIEHLNIAHIDRDLPAVDLDAGAWAAASEVRVGTYWSGQPAPAGRHFAARLLWSDAALYVRFEAEQDEPLVVSRRPNLNSKTLGLWDRDVCEIFVAPDLRNRYFEFEVAPTGEWVDLAVEITPEKRVVDTEYASGMLAAARVEDGKIVAAIRIPWTAFGKTPRAGEVWLGNLFRCVGKDPDRGYLAWRPTMTKRPNFHVPGAFGEFVFTK